MTMLRASIVKSVFYRHAALNLLAGISHFILHGRLLLSFSINDSTVSVQILLLSLSSDITSSRCATEKRFIAAAAAAAAATMQTHLLLHPTRFSDDAADARLRNKEESCFHRLSPPPENKYDKIRFDSISRPTASQIPLFFFFFFFLLLLYRVSTI